jgi:hypothetical protein
MLTGPSSASGVPGPEAAYALLRPISPRTQSRRTAVEREREDRDDREGDGTPGIGDVIVPLPGPPATCCKWDFIPHILHPGSSSRCE